jgi:hypothetical protein
MEMNGVRRRASEGVQRKLANVTGMISEPGHPTGDARDPLEEETTMFKTISAALVAVSVLAAPAFAGAPGKATQAPTNKTVQAPVIKAETTKSKVLNANASMGRHHHKHFRHHRQHKHMGALKVKHFTPKVATKHIAPTAKRG